VSRRQVADKLVTIFIPLVSSDLEIGKEAFDSLFKQNSVRSEFVIVEIVFKIWGYKPIPSNHYCTLRLVFVELLPLCTRLSSM
jgi:hypothetical protein